MQEIQPKYFGTKCAARYLGLSYRTLEKYRTYGGGPAYHKIGRKVMYTIKDMDFWAEKEKFKTTGVTLQPRY